MKINRTNSRYTPVNFNARLTSNVEVNIEDRNLKYDIYELTNNDIDNDFVKKLYSALDLKKLMPSFEDYKISQWKSILKGSITHNTLHKDSKNYLIVNEDNKPCGAIMASKRFHGKDYFVDYICTWPTSVNHREPLAGKVLMLNLFSKLLNNPQESINPHRFIKLEALNNSLFNSISKYLELGYRIRGGDNNSTLMSISYADLEKSLNKYKKYVKINDIENNNEEIDLSERLDITY